MAACNNCGSTIIFGGEKEGDYRFCSKKCHQSGRYIVVANQIPIEFIKEQTKILHQGSCPKCKKQNGPVDIHTAHKIWSAVVLTSWVNSPQASCRSCGIKSQSLGALSSLLLGWWGFPWGIIMTPVQIIRNIIGMAKKSNPDVPSEKLEHLVRINLGRQAYINQQQQKNNA